MLPNELWTAYPTLYHMAEAGSWPNIRKRGLLSTSALLDLFKIKGDQRFEIESTWRSQAVMIIHPQYGRAIIRDQKPMPEKALTRCLDGVSPREWYELLNHKTFFWMQEQRLVRLLNARAYRNRAHDVIKASTQALVERHNNQITLSPINSGALFGGAGVRRGSKTFKKIEDFPFHEIRRKRRDDAVVELAVEYSVPDIKELTLSVEEWFLGKRSKLLWQKDH